MFSQAQHSLLPWWNVTSDSRRKLHSKYKRWTSCSYQKMAWRELRSSSQEFHYFYWATKKTALFFLIQEWFCSAPTGSMPWLFSSKTKQWIRLVLLRIVILQNTEDGMLRIRIENENVAKIWKKSRKLLLVWQAQLILKFISLQAQACSLFDSFLIDYQHLSRPKSLAIFEMQESKDQSRCTKTEFMEGCQARRTR